MQWDFPPKKRIRVIVNTDAKNEAGAEFGPTMHYRHTGRNRPIRVYEDIDARFIHEDFSLSWRYLCARGVCRVQLSTPAHLSTRRARSVTHRLAWPAPRSIWK